MRDAFDVSRVGLDLRQGQGLRGVGEEGWDEGKDIDAARDGGEECGGDEGSRRRRCQAVAALTGERHPRNPALEECGPTAGLKQERELIRR